MSYESTPTLYEKYGAAIDRVVSLFYQKVLDDKDLQPFFLGSQHGSPEKTHVRFYYLCLRRAE